jgi:predicted nucleotidyltransferase
LTPSGYDRSVDNVTLGKADIEWHRVSDPERRERVLSAVAASCAAEPTLVAAYVFGSFARNEEVVRDLDIGLVHRDEDADEAGWTLVERVRQRLEAAAELGGLPVDVRMIPANEPVFAARVIAEGILVHESERRARIAFEVRVISRWIDFRPAWYSIRQAYLERLARGRL